MTNTQNNLTLSSQHRLCNTLLEDHPSPKTHSPRLLQLQIELENGQKVYISPKPDDEPFRLATEFCQKHNLDSEMIDVLTDSIQKSIFRSQNSCNKDDLQALTLRNDSQTNRFSYDEHNDKNRPLKSSSKHNQYYSKKRSLNIGCSLYEKSMIHEEAHKNWINRQKQRKEKEQLIQCTHIPNINTVSRCIADNLRAFRQSQTQNTNVQTKATTVTPSSMLTSCAINQQQQKSSKQLHSALHSITSSNSIFNRLYNCRSQSNKSIVLKDQHHPTINQISKQIVGTSKFSDRMTKYLYQKQQKIAKNNQKQKQNKHTPKIGLPPSNRNIQALPIGDYLYNHRKIAVNQQTLTPKLRLVNQTSDRIYEYRKEEAFCRLFKLLDTQQAGKISWSKGIYDRLEEEEKPILRPFLQELHMMDVQLDQEEFKRAMNLLFSTLDPASKNVLLNFNNKKTQPSPTEPTSFQPELNRKSQRIVRGMNRARMSIYDYCSIKSAVKEQTLECQRVAKQKQSLQECTFHPNIQKSTFYF